MSNRYAKHTCFFVYIAELTIGKIKFKISTEK